jgi:hypothetical protein
MNKFALTIAIIAGTTLAAAVAQAAGAEAHVDTNSALMWLMLTGAFLAIVPQKLLKTIKIKN